VLTSTQRSAVVLPRHQGRASRPIHKALRGQSLFVVTTLGAVVIAHLVGRTVHWAGPVGFLFFTGALLALVPFVLGARLWSYRYGHHRADPNLAPGVAWKRAIRDLLLHDLTLERAANVAVSLVLTAWLIAIYTGWKHAFPAIAPFSWDSKLAGLDAALHGGRQPWELLAPILDYPQLVRALDRLYFSVWGATAGFALVWMALWPPSSRRTQFFVAHTLTWVLVGGVGASLLSSAGPFAYGAVTALPDPFAPLMARLHEIEATGSLMALTSQRALWAVYTADPALVVVGGGISAMPSMHVAMAALWVMAAWQSARWLRALAVGYLGIVLVGSVLSGMHYAVDGYVSVLLVAGIWWFTGRICWHTAP
jgi:hypothetical protein